MQHVADVNDQPSSNIDYQNEAGLSALHYAVIHQNEEIITTLVDGGADMNLTEKHQYTPFGLAVFNNKMESVRTLNGCGAHVNERVRHGMTPLHIASSCSEGSKEMIELLVELGARINATNRSGFIPFHCAVHFESLKEFVCWHLWGLM